ncbi:MAG: protease modulator HflC [Gammaproteobacteria bacterium]|nr:protease modulator HflC [Gammaproteobacteria bacterium]
MSVRTIVILVLLIIVGALLFDTLFIVHERERALKLRFGEAVSVYGDADAGLHFKIPIAEEVRVFDGRILTLDTPAQRYFTIEKKPLIVDLFVKWRVGDVERYYTATSGDEQRASTQLEDRVNEGLRNQIGRRDMHEVISGERDLLMNELTANLNGVMSEDFGITVIDIRVKRIDLPDEVSDAVFDRMNSEREIEARQYRATGQEIAIGIRADADRQATVISAEAQRESEKIRGDGDANSAEIYADAYGQDPDFYSFYRSINAYVKVFEGGNTMMVMDPSSEFFRFLKEEQP